MKATRFITLAACALLALASCTNQNPESTEKGNLVYREFTASLDATAPDTRTALSGTAVLWNRSGEAITLIDADGNGYTLNQKSVSEDRKTATFSGEVPDGALEYAVYPAVNDVTYKSGMLTLNIPGSQNAAEDSFGEGANVAISKVGTDGSLYFQNIGGLVGICVNADNISSARFSASGSSQAALTGEALIHYGSVPEASTDATDGGYGYVELTGGLESGKTYWAVVAPGSYTNLSVVFTTTEGRTATFTKDATLTVERSKAVKISPFTITDKDWDDYTEPGGTAMLTYSECSGEIAGYDNEVSYTNAYGTWLIRAYNNSALQLNSGKRSSYIRTPVFDGPVKEISLTLSGTNGSAATIYACKTAGTTSSLPTPNVSVSANGAGTYTLDATSLNSTSLYIRSQGVVLITKVNVVWGGGESGGGNQNNPTVTTGAASSITTTAARLSGSWSDVGTTVREAGFYIGTSASSLNDVYQADITSGASGSFSVSIDGLYPGTKYYYRAYIQLQDGSDIQELLGTISNFTTPAQPDVPSTGSQPGWAELPVMNISTVTIEGKQYMVNSTDDSQYYAWHICPDFYGPGGKLARNYTVCYSAEHHCPVWVAAPRHSSYETGSGRSSYGVDRDIPTDIQYKSTDTGGGCNKGHMLGSAERTVTSATNKQVFYYTNIAPQLSIGFNTGGGGWNTLEDKVDSYVCSDTLYVVIGCYFDKYTDGYGKTQYPSTISFGGRSDVHMPTMFYYALLRTKSGNSFKDDSSKSVADCTADELQCAAFVRTHTNDLKGQAVTSREMMSISDLEAITGVTYFTNVPNAPKNTFSASDWGL